MKNNTLVRWMAVWWCLCVLSLARAADNNSLAGVYTMQGAKGAITLSLQDEGEGKVSGSLKGGDIQATLKGFPERTPGALQRSVLGTMSDANAHFLSYFRAYREGGQLIFEIIEAGPGGDPDFKRKSRIPFPAGLAQPPAANRLEPATEEPEDKSQGKTAKPDFNGTFKDDTLTLESKAVAGQTGAYSGTIQMAGQTFAFTAREDEGFLRGEFKSPDGAFPFEAKLEGRTLNLSSGGTLYKLAQQGGNPLAKPTNPLAKPAKTVPPNPLAKPNTINPGAGNQGALKPENKTPPDTAIKTASLPDKSAGGGVWKIYKHPTGLSVRYPPTWQTKDLGGVLSLTPPDLVTNAQGPVEAYLIMASGAEGVQSVDDPRVAALIEQQVMQLMPLLKRSGQPQKIVGGTAPGLLMSWESDNPGGLAVRANVMTTILKGYGVALLALGDKTKIAAREGVIKEIFASLAAGAGERDPRLVGRWKFWSYKGSANGKFGTESTRRFQFIQDGTCLWQSNSESSGTVSGRDSLGNQTFVAGIAGQGDNGDRGQWTASNGQLYVLWDDGTTGTWGYEVRPAGNGNRLFLKGSGKQADEWMPE